jgi:hypothetical protein
MTVESRSLPSYTCLSPTPVLLHPPYHGCSRLELEQADKKIPAED